MSPSSKKILFFGSSLVLVLFFLQFVTPVYTALFLAFALSPIMTWAKAHKILFGLILIMFCCMIYLLIPKLYIQMIHALEELIEVISSLQVHLPKIISEKDSYDWFVQMLEPMVSGKVVFTSLHISSAFVMESALFLSLFLLALVTFYFNPNWMISWLPHRTHSAVQTLYADAQSVTALFFRNELLLILITWLLSSLFLLCIHFPHAWVVGLGIAVLDVIPFLGISLFYIPLGTYFFMTDQVLEGFLTILFFLFLIVSRHLIEPLLWKQQIQLPSIIVLIIISSSLLVFGVKGFLLIPLCFVVSIYLQTQKKPDQ